MNLQHDTRNISCLFNYLQFKKSFKKTNNTKKMMESFGDCPLKQKRLSGNDNFNSNSPNGEISGKIGRGLIFFETYSLYILIFHI